MGCDIHLFVEKRQSDGSWSAIQGVNEPEIDDLQGYLEMSKERGEDPSYWELRIQEEKAGTFDFVSTGRNYMLFAILAGVRNYYSLTPISKPRGLPGDVSDQVRSNSEEWGDDGHSHSYLSITDLFAFNWESGFIQEGWVDAKNYQAFKENGRPGSWSRSVGGGGVDHVTHYDMDNFLANNGEYYALGSSPYTLVQWKETYKDKVGTFYSWSIPKLKELAEDDPGSVRIVFWFDN
jgi:hypothetical protein